MRMKTALPAGFWRAAEMAKGKLETITAIICITILESIALMKGIDGMFLSTVIAIIAGLGGFWIGRATSNGSNTNP
jgi:hypothetical protein